MSKPYMALTFKKEEDFISYMKTCGDKNSSVILSERKGNNIRVLIGVDQLIPTGVLVTKNKNGKRVSIEVCSGYLQNF